MGGVSEVDCKHLFKFLLKRCIVLMYLVSPLQFNSKEKYMIIDIHAHTSEHKMWGLHTESATLDDIEVQARAVGVEKVVVLATYFPLKGTGLKNYDLLERIRDREMFLAFGSLDLTQNVREGIEELKLLARLKLISGIKVYTGYQDFDIAGAGFQFVCEIARKYNLPVMFHTGALHHCCSFVDRESGKRRCGKSFCKLDELQDLSMPRNLVYPLENYSDVNFIFSHMGEPYFDQMIEVMARYDNVYTDISGLIQTGGLRDIPEFRNILSRAIDLVLQLPNGINRLMFGTDFPIQSYEDSVGFVNGMGLSDVDKEKVFSGNTKRLLRL